jgi:arylformamidase
MAAEDSQDPPDQAALDAAYDPERRAGPRGPYIERYVRESEAARRTLDGHLDVPYGTNPRESLDIFPSRRRDSPVVMFIHGGYWRALSCKEFSFVARGLVPHDITVGVMSYDLCPQVTIADITRQSHAAAAFLARNASRWAGDPDRIFVIGHSAGGQQVGMLLSHNEERGSSTSGGPALIKGGITISGLFDLRPLRHSWLQPTLKLTEEAAVDQSPLLRIPSRSAPALVLVGGEESPAFIDQSLAYHTARTRARLQSEYRILAGLNHYQTVDPLLDPESSLTASILAFIGR